MIAKESPLKGMNIGTVATVAIRELPGLHTIDFRVEPGSATHTAVTKELGFDLPMKVGQSSMISIHGGAEAHALCLAPDWWLIVELPETKQQLAALQLNNDYHLSVVEVSGQRTTIELEGPNAHDVLAHLWEQDLREKNFPVGRVSQGLMAKAPGIVLHIAPFRYRVMVRSSFALHLWKALVDAAEEWM
jgi:sarcosine oxidase subunit gamma